MSQEGSEEEETDVTSCPGIAAEAGRKFQKLLSEHQ
jgi:hypothetical protein